MLIEREGEVIEIDPVQAALEESILKALRRHGPLKQTDLWYRSSAPYHGRKIFNQALESLVQRDAIRRSPTGRVNVFSYRMAPDKKRREKAATRRNIGRSSSISETQAISPEVNES